MIPANETEEDFNGSIGEARLSGLFKQMQTDCYVFHSARWNKQTVNSKKRKYLDWHEADFLVYFPSRGIVSIEVKDGRICYSQEEGWQQINSRTGAVKTIDPMLQAENSKFYYQRLINEKVPEAFCPVCTAVWFTAADRSSIRGEYPNNYKKETVFWENDLSSPQHVQQLLMSLFDYYGFETRLNPSQETVKKIIDLISPEFGVFESLTTVHNVASYLFHRMTEEQSTLLDYLEEQQTAAIHGCAGTGKTMLAIRKAKRFAEDDKVLFLCFNALLRDYLQKEYESDNLTITNLDSLYTKCTHGKLPYGAEGAAEKRELIYSFLCKWQTYHLDYKHIIIDEGQDFANEHLEALHAIAMENDGCFYVFYDKHQFCQGDEMPTWIDDMECRLVLSRNCRNTYEIALTSTRPVGIDEKKVKMKEDNNGLVTDLTKPRLFFTESEKNLIEKLNERIDGYVNAGIERSHIVVLTAKTLETSIIRPEMYHLSQSNFLSAEETKGRILFTTIRKFKGLEADAVIFVDVDADSFSNEKSRNNFYIGTSRAKFFLDIVTMLPDQHDILSMASAIAKTDITSRPRAIAAIASGLKVKIG